MLRDGKERLRITNKYRPWYPGAPVVRRSDPLYVSLSPQFPKPLDSSSWAMCVSQMKAINKYAWLDSGIVVVIPLILQLCRNPSIGARSEDYLICHSLTSRGVFSNVQLFWGSVISYSLGGPTSYVDHLCRKANYGLLDAHRRLLINV